VDQHARFLPGEPAKQPELGALNSVEYLGYTIHCPPAICRRIARSLSVALFVHRIDVGRWQSPGT
jgi:hypothetical protein